MRIYKYPLVVIDEQVVSMPIGAEILSVADQRGTLCLWVSCDPENSVVSRHIRIIGTGHDFEYGDLKIIGTVPMSNGFVWHVFEDQR